MSIRKDLALILNKARVGKVEFENNNVDLIIKHKKFREDTGEEYYEYDFVSIKELLLLKKSKSKVVSIVDDLLKNIPVKVINSIKKEI